MICCRACISLFGASRADKESFRRLIADVSQRFGVNWKVTTRGFVSRARQESKWALTHGKVARREGSFCVFDRLTRDDIHRNRMVANGVSYETMQEWDKMFADREVAPLPVYTVPYEVRERRNKRCSPACVEL